MRVDGDCFTGWSDAGYPRPQLCRPAWTDLTGPWDLAPDPQDVGTRQRWYLPDAAPFDQTVIVPFPPGSPASGTGPDADQDVIWYRRTVTAQDLREAGWTPQAHRDGARAVLHLEGVDHRADVWVDGRHAVTHEGGFTPFDVDLTDYLPDPDGEVPDEPPTLTLVVRAEDRRTDVGQPRGKQDWREQTHGIWYQRTTGIWRDVWLEVLPPVAIGSVHWTTDVDAATVACEVGLTDRPAGGAGLDVRLRLAGRPLAGVRTEMHDDRATVTLPVPDLVNRMEWDDLLWSPEHPVLVDADLVLTVPARPHDAADGGVVAPGCTDTVLSYLGMRSVSRDARYLRLNRMPVYVRGVLDQGYWPQSRLTPPSPDALRADLQLAKDLGFNTVRAHQRTPDRRYLTWADRLGLMVWGEFPSAFAYTRPAVHRTVTEWLRVVERDRSHPSLVVWVPFNESWGVPQVVTDAGQQAFVDGVVSLTRALDPTRLVVANDGWEQLDTDLVAVHDYGTTGAELTVNYRDADAVARTVTGTGPQGRTVLLREPWHDDRPVLVSEFGGISLDTAGTGAWGYAVTVGTEHFARVVAELFDALHASPVIAGFCWTQLTDTEQETNGLCTADRSPKLPADRIRQIVHGPPGHHANQQRPRVVREVPAEQEED